MAYVFVKGEGLPKPFVVWKSFFGIFTNFTVDFRYLPVHTQAETQEVFKVGSTTIKGWNKLLSATGTVEKRPLNRKARVYESDKLCAYIEEHPQALLKEIAEHFGGYVSDANSALARAKITLKKRHLHTKNATKKSEGNMIICHSDRGVQYAATLYRQELEQFGLRSGISRKGDPYDNAVAENFFSCLKCELVHLTHFTARAQAQSAIFAYIEVFYNSVRPHSALGWLTPNQFASRFAACAA